MNRLDTPPAGNENAGLPDPDDPVLAWRLLRLLRMGVPTPLAVRLAASTVDLHQLERCLQAGCPADLAATILL